MWFKSYSTWHKIIFFFRFRSIKKFIQFSFLSVNNAMPREGWGMTTIIKISKCICQDERIPQSISSHVLITFSEWKQHSSLNDLLQASLVQYFFFATLHLQSTLYSRICDELILMLRRFFGGLKFVRMSQRHDWANIWEFIALFVINFTGKSNFLGKIRFYENVDWNLFILAWNKNFNGLFTFEVDF